MRCEKFETLALNSQITVHALNPVPSNTFQPPDGDFWGAGFTPGTGPPLNTGVARIVDMKRAGGTGHEVKVNNICLCFSAGFGQVLQRITFAFGEYGGNLNLMLNGQFVNFQNFQDIDGKIIRGVKVTVLSGGGGQDFGKIEFTGPINDQMWWGHLAIGGQELWIDDWCWE